MNNSYKYYLLLATGNNIFFHAFNLSHDKIFHLSFLYFFFLLTPHCLLSLTLVSSLSSYFSLYLSPFSPFLFPLVTPFSDKVFIFYFFPHKSVNSFLTIWYFGIYQTNCTRIFFRLNNLAYVVF